MPYLYSNEQRQIQEEARRVLAAHCSGDRLRGLIERRGESDAALWKTACDMGWPAVAIPESAGGLGLTLIDALIVAEEWGRALAGAPFLVSGSGVACVLEAVGDPLGMLSRIAAGEMIATIAFAEGSEMLPLRPTARFDGGLVNGIKPAVLAGEQADYALVLAAGADGAATLVGVDLSGPGVTRELLDTVDNSRNLATIRLADAPGHALSGDGAALAARSLDRLALMLAAEGVGGAEASLALAVDYANQRQAFGQAIGKFQGVKHALAEIYVLIEMARASVLDAAVAIMADAPDADALVAAARLNAVEAYEASASGATQVHGGIGVTWEADLHLHYRRARALAMEAGPSWYWEDRIVARMEEAA